MNDLDNILQEVEQGGHTIPPEEYAEKKQAERRAVYELADQTALDIAQDSGKFQQYLDVQSQFDRYSETNALLVLAQKPEATRLGDFDYWKSRGGSVKKGETGISIIEPSGEYAKGDGTTGISYNIKKVFDISQIDTRKMEQQPAKQHTERDLLKSMVAHAPVKIDLADDLPDDLGALYDPDTQRISLRRGMNFAQTFQSLAQELAISDLRASPDTHADTIFSANAMAYMLCKKHGVDAQFSFADAPTAFSGMDALEIKSELSQIRAVAANTSERMAKTLEPPTKNARTQDDRGR